MKQSDVNSTKTLSQAKRDESLKGLLERLEDVCQSMIYAIQAYGKIHEKRDK